MKKFLAVYTGTPMEKTGNSWSNLSDKEIANKTKEGIDSWQNWAKKYSNTILDQGNPLGKTKRITSSGISDTKNNLCAYTIIEAESYEAAAKIFLNHPHFSIFPGDGVEIMECLDLPAL